MKDRNSKVLICSGCLERTEIVDFSAEEVTCSKCVQRRIQVLREVGQEMFKQIFYKLPKKEGKKLLKTILEQKNKNSFKGHHLRQARKGKGWSQTALAGFLDISKNTILAMENDRRPLSLEAIGFIQQQGKKSHAYISIYGENLDSQLVANK